MSDTRRSWEDAIASYEEMAAGGDRSAVFLLDVARCLAAGPVGSALEARAWEECLGVFAPEDARPTRGTPWAAVVSEADEIDYCLDEFGESPPGLDPACWRVELRGVVSAPSGATWSRPWRPGAASAGRPRWPGRWRACSRGCSPVSHERRQTFFTIEATP